ncbi:DUF5133 domain-containing protein [Streptomyces sp. NPDC102259]|uniref:DUF5133 domain-containing protein n=1 Tax=Streptomyces sp. NPDC102259 TaxID=3366148 RepID=UPI00380EB0D2
MLMPLPATLRRLVKDYEVLASDQGASTAGTSSARLRDLTYTLCVSTGTRDISEALQAAQTYLESAPATRPAPAGSLPGSPAPAGAPAPPSSTEPQPLSREIRSVVAREPVGHPIAAVDLEPSEKRTMASH